MASELQRIEQSVNVVVGKPVAWAVYGLLLVTRYSARGLVSGAKWLRQRWTAHRRAA